MDQFPQSSNPKGKQVSKQTGESHELKVQTKQSFPKIAEIPSGSPEKELNPCFELLRENEQMRRYRGSPASAGRPRGAAKAAPGPDPGGLGPRSSAGQGHTPGDTEWAGGCPRGPALRRDSRRPRARRSAGRKRGAERRKEVGEREGRRGSRARVGCALEAAGR